MNLLFTITYCIWLFSEIVINRLLHSKVSDKQNADKNSLSVIWIIIIATIILSVFISIRFYLPIFSNPALEYVGIGIIYLGIILRIIAIISLGRFFTVDVTIRQDHKLKINGFYKYIRHPSYFASLISFLGFGISLNNWLSLSLIIITSLTAFIFRIKIEEKVLTEKFGHEYLEYKKNTHAIIPFIY